VSLIAESSTLIDSCAFRNFRPIQSRRTQFPPSADSEELFAVAELGRNQPLPPDIHLLQ